jgi:glycosyltransferase involved in cell wall biosynthesis
VTNIGHSASAQSHPRILQVVLSLNPGGTERLVVQLATQLHAEIPMMVCCLDDAGAWSNQVEDQGIHVEPLERRPGFRPLLGRAIASAVRRHRATAIHAHHYSPFVYSSLSRLWQQSAPVIFTEHGRLSNAPPSAKRRRVNRILQHVPRAVFAVSQDLRRHIVAEGFSPDRVGVIYNGIELGPAPSDSAREQARRELGVAEGVSVFCTIARLDPVKDLGTFIDAVAQVSRDRNVVGLIVGDGPDRPGLESRARTLGASPVIRFLGHRDDARALLAGSDVYVNCSISEGISLTILEAMAAGLPIVATSVGGTPEVIDASCGRLIPPENPTALADALKCLLLAPEVCRQMGAGARRRVETHFDLRRMIGEYRDVYTRAC